MEEFREGKTPSFPSRPVLIRNDKYLSKFSKSDWMRGRSEKAMQKTTERLNIRKDLTQEQKNKIEKFLNSYKGVPVWNKQSLSPEGRIATARLLSGNKDREKVLKGIPSHEREVIKNIEKYYSDEADAALAPSIEILKRREVEFHVVKLVGEPDREIVRHAEHAGCDIIAMGTRGHTGMANLVLGSVAMKVVATSKVPVLLMR